MIAETATAMVDRYQFGVDTWIVDDGHQLSPKQQWGIGSFFSRTQRAKIIALNSYNPVLSSRVPAAA